LPSRIQLAAGYQWPAERPEIYAELKASLKKLRSAEAEQFGRVAGRHPGRREDHPDEKARNRPRRPRAALKNPLLLFKCLFITAAENPFFLAQN